MKWLQIFRTTVGKLRLPLLSIGLAAGAALMVMFLIGQTPASQPKREVGVNIAGIAFYTSEIVFVDAFKQSQPWTSQLPGKPYNEGGPLSLDTRGWVKKLNGNGHYAESLMFVDLQGHYPGGKYICLYEGDGAIEFAEGASVLEARPGRLVVNVAPKDGPIALRLTKTNPLDPVRNIRLIMPGFEKTYMEQPFHPDFLKRWSGFRVARFTGWSVPNGCKVEKWSDRVTPEHASQGTVSGVALEYQIQLANALQADPWLCLPVRVDDDYVREFARLLRAKLDGDRKIYLEYANECWHSGFDGGQFCAERGKALGLSKNDYEAQIRFYSQRSVEIFKIVQEVFGSHDRLVRVLNTAPDSTWAIETVTDWKNAGKNVDAIAIAPYFGGQFGKPASEKATAALTVEQLLDACQQDIEANAKRTKETAKFVKARGLKFLAYEGGQHLVGVEGVENNELLTKLFQSANRNGRMKDLYLQDLRGWDEAGGGLFCVFVSMGYPTKWGSWGILDYFDQDEKTAPKMQAIREFMRK